MCPLVLLHVPMFPQHASMYPQSLSDAHMVFVLVYLCSYTFGISPDTPWSFSWYTYDLSPGIHVVSWFTCGLSPIHMWFLLVQMWYISYGFSPGTFGLTTIHTQSLSTHGLSHMHPWPQNQNQNQKIESESENIYLTIIHIYSGLQ